MKTLLILSLVLLSWSPVSQTSDQVPKQKSSSEELKIYKQIRKNNPLLDKAYSQKLAKIILKKSKKHGVSPRVLAAMLMQESAYKISAKNVRCGMSVSTGRQDCVVVDYGIGQINSGTIKHFKLNRAKLLSDVEYAIDASAMVLSDFKRMYGHKESEYWTRYNASNLTKRGIYKRLVARYL